MLIHRWRANSDSLCDAALETIFPNPSSSVGKDLLASLEEHVAQHPGPNPARDFWAEIHRVPPQSLAVSDDEVTIAQEFFVDHAVQIMQALLHYSLAAGFAR